MNEWSQQEVDLDLGLEITGMSKISVSHPWDVKRDLIKQGFHGQMHLGIVGLETAFFNQSFPYASMHWESLEGFTYLRSNLFDHGNIFYWRFGDINLNQYTKKFTLRLVNLNYPKKIISWIDQCFEHSIMEPIKLWFGDFQERGKKKSCSSKPSCVKERPEYILCCPWAVLISGLFASLV